MFKFDAKRDIPLTIFAIVSLIIRLKMINVFDFWYDEAITGILMYAKSDSFISVLMHENTPPLYYLLIKGWTLLFGINDLSLRLPSVIFGTLTVVMVFLTARKYFGIKISYIAGTLATINPFFINYSIEARTYALYGFLAICAFYFLLAKRDKLFVLMLLLLSVTQYLAAFYALIMCLYYVIHRLFIAKRSFISVFFHMLPVGIAYVFAFYKVRALNVAVQYIDWVRPATYWNIPRSFASYIFGI